VGRHCRNASDPNSAGACPTVLSGGSPTPSARDPMVKTYSIAPCSLRHHRASEVHRIVAAYRQGAQMRGRDTILLFCSGALSRSFPVLAQTTAPVQRIGWVEANPGDEMDNWPRVAEELALLGWKRGGNIRADVQVAMAPARLPSIAKEVVAARPNLIVSNGTPATIAILTESRRQFCSSRWQRHRLRELRTFACGQMAAIAEGG